MYPKLTHLQYSKETFPHSIKWSNKKFWPVKTESNKVLAVTWIEDDFFYFSRSTGHLHTVNFFQLQRGYSLYTLIWKYQLQYKSDEILEMRRWRNLSRSKHW